MQQDIIYNIICSVYNQVLIEARIGLVNERVQAFIRRLSVIKSLIRR